jgi:hypothetical protein
LVTLGIWKFFKVIHALKSKTFQKKVGVWNFNSDASKKLDVWNYNSDASKKLGVWNFGIWNVIEKLGVWNLFLLSLAIGTDNYKVIRAQQASHRRWKTARLKLEEITRSGEQGPVHLFLPELSEHQGIVAPDENYWSRWFSFFSKRAVTVSYSEPPAGLAPKSP